MQRLLPSTHLGSCKDIAYEVGVILQTDGASCPTPSITLKKALSITEGIHNLAGVANVGSGFGEH